MGVSKKGGTQQLLVSLLKMTMLGCFGGTTILGNTHIKVHYIYIYIYIHNLCHMLRAWLILGALFHFNSAMAWNHG